MKIKDSRCAPPRIEMLPLIDIVFLLLVFFIYAMLSMAVHHGQPVDLPRSSSAVPDQRQAISVTIQANDQGAPFIFVDEEPVNLQSLSKVLQKRTMKIPDDKKSEVQIFADKTVSYQELFQVLDRIRQAGLTRISLQAQPEETAP